MFGRLYDRTVALAAHAHARWYLAGLSFAESSFFPIPPDVMLAPMVLARPRHGMRLATLTTVASVLGGLLGYLIGVVAFSAVEPLLVDLGYHDDYLLVREWFEDYGFWAILLAGFSPIPYKVFTITGGALAMPLPVFVIGSVLGRGGRFFLVAGLLQWGGEGFERRLRAHIDTVGWAVVALVAAYIAYRMLI